MTVLGVDWGAKHTGLGLGWTDIGLSQPLTIVDTNKAVSKILSVCRAESVAKIIIGVSEGQSAAQARAFAAALQNKTKIPLELADETLSSAQAKSSRRGHAAAAAIILELWLDDHRDSSV